MCTTILGGISLSIFKRLRDLTLSNVYALIEKAEDPVKLTDQYIRDMQEDLADAEKRALIEFLKTF